MIFFLSFFVLSTLNEFGRLLLLMVFFFIFKVVSVVCKCLLFVTFVDTFLGLVLMGIVLFSFQIDLFGVLE